MNGTSEPTLFRQFARIDQHLPTQCCGYKVSVLTQQIQFLQPGVSSKDNFARAMTGPLSAIRNPLDVGKLHFQFIR